MIPRQRADVPCQFQQAYAWEIRRAFYKSNDVYPCKILLLHEEGFFYLDYSFSIYGQMALS